MLISKIKNYKNISFVFLLIFLGDSLTFFFLKETFNYSWVIKAFVTLLLCFNVIYSKKLIINKKLFIGLIYFIITIVFISNDYVFRTTQFFKYFSGILFFYLLMVVNQKKRVEHCLVLIFSFYAITTILSFIFNIIVFKTYPNSERFGFLPFFSSQNEFSYIAMCSVFFFTKKYLNHKKSNNALLLATSLIALLLIGTKACYLFFVLFIFYVLIKNRKYILLVTIFLSTITLILAFQKHFLSFINKFFKFFISVYETNGLINALSSNRIIYLKSRLKHQIDYLTLDNYFLGGGLQKYMTEMSFIDLFLFFGIIGLFIYFYNYKFIYDNFLKIDKIGWFFILSVYFISFIAGYFFENFSSQFYFTSVVWYYYFHKRALLV